MLEDFNQVLTIIVSTVSIPFDTADILDSFYIVLPVVGGVLLSLLLVIIRFFVRIGRNVG